jgi:uncharacterized membrane protein
LELSNASCEAAREVNFNSVLFNIIVLLLLALCLVSTASAKYSLERAETNITVSARGMVHVEESVSYAFDGDYIDVHRELKALPGESIRNVEGHCSDKGCKLRVERIPEGYRLIGKLPDPTPEKVTLFISYDYYGAVKVHRDVSEFHYKLWGGEWEKSVGSLKGSVTLPTENGSKVRYWIHPTGYTQEINAENNVINLRTGEIPSTQWYEIKAVFPRIVSPDPHIVQIDNVKGLEEILTIEDVYQKKTLILDCLYRKTVIFSLFILAFPLLIYFRYGREQKIDYKKTYERKPPADSKPAIVNAIIYGRMGISKIEGFTATFMDLANRNYISLRNLKPEEIGSLSTPESEPPESEPRDFMVELVNNEIYSEGEGNLYELEDFEKDVLYLLKNHAPERKISWGKFKKELESGKDFYRFIMVWNKKVEAHIAFDKFFQSTGNIYMNRFARFILIAAIVYYILISGFFPSDAFPMASKINVLTSLIGIFGFVMIKYSGMFTTIFGRWTPEGNLYYKQWDNFKKYLTDLSALKEYSPESIKIWDSSLVYAASLGVAKEALQNMSLVVPSEQLKESHFHPISYNYSQSNYGCGNACSSSCSGDVNREDNVGGSSGGGRGGAE